MKPIESIISETLGKASAIFMSSSLPGTKQVMPEAALKALSDDAVSRIEELSQLPPRRPEPNPPTKINGWT